jgi:predicted transcriptional regulator
MLRNLMTPNPKVCTPSMTSEAVARIMGQENVGALPVIDSASKKLVGIVTDRDLCSRVIAKGHSPAEVNTESHSLAHRAASAESRQVGSWPFWRSHNRKRSLPPRKRAARHSNTTNDLSAAEL